MSNTYTNLSLQIVYTVLSNKILDLYIYIFSIQGEEDRGFDMLAKSGPLPLRHTPGQTS